MILVILTGALIALDVLAWFFGADSRNLIDREGRSRPSGLDVAGHGR